MASRPDPSLSASPSPARQPDFALHLFGLGPAGPIWVQLPSDPDRTYFRDMAKPAQRPVRPRIVAALSMSAALLFGNTSCCNRSAHGFRRPISRLFRRARARWATCRCCWPVRHRWRCGIAMANSRKSRSKPARARRSSADPPRGYTVPVDGKIADGITILDQSALTGGIPAGPAFFGAEVMKRRHQCRRGVRSDCVAPCRAKDLCGDCPPGRLGTAIAGADVAAC